jgi:hypothetical protein
VAIRYDERAIPNEEGGAMLIEPNDDARDDGASPFGLWIS